MTAHQHELVFEFGRDRGAAKGSAAWWVFRCGCSCESSKNWTVIGGFKTRREAERAAEALARSVADELSAAMGDSGGIH